MNKIQQLMMARMGMYKSGESDVGGLNANLNHFGGYPQQNRMINDKYRSFKRALFYSYQGAWIDPISQEEKTYRALINPNKVKQDYDDKILSVDYSSGLKPGDVFKWRETNTYWLIYLQELTELAYFRGDIRRCNYTIEWKDENDEVHSTYIAVRGPVETKINYIQKSGDSIDTPNHSLHILMPKTDASVKYFTRYARFYLHEDQSICWRVEGFDSISMPGVLEITAVEYYGNKDTDSDGIVNNLVIKPIDEETDSGEMIKGKLLIRPKTTYTYECAAGGTWTIVEPNAPVTLVQIDEYTATAKWEKSHSGIFTIKCGDFSRVIVVESLF